jgi:hypothetical protein
MPGNHVVTISATAPDGKTGITSIQFQVRGELSPTTVSQAKLSTTEAQKYLNSSPEDFELNPLGYILYNYYQKLYQEYLEDEKISEALAQEQAYIEKQKETENELRLKAIEEFGPGMGIFSGPQYEDYVNSLDEAVRDTVVKHLNFTKNLVENAQELRNEILENGGTAEEAQLAYLENIATSRNLIENFDNYTETNSDESLESVNTNSTKSLNPDKEESIIEETSTESPIKVDVDGINVEVEFNESVFFVNVNGTVLEFLVNGTEIILINNE